MKEKKKRRSLNTYEILILILAIVSMVTFFLDGEPYIADNGKKAAVVGATFHDFLMAPIAGFHDASDVIGFVFCLGAFLALVNATGALETGINSLVKKMKGKEIILVPILMFLFSIGGTTYGMGEETVGFYILLASTMLAAGMDPMVGAATVLLGAGTGVLGSTINPFSTGAGIAAAKAAKVYIDTGIAYGIGLILWIGTYIISAIYTVNYAKKVMEGKGSILTPSQLKEAEEAYGSKDADASLTGKQKVCLWIFALTFLVMILGFIPWEKLNTGVFNGLKFTKFLTGNQLGAWWFDDAATWFTLMGIVIALIGMEDKSKIPQAIESGIADMIGVNLVIALARATTVVMNKTGVGTWMVQTSVKGLTESGISAGFFGFLNYLLHIGLSFLVPSSSGLAGLSAPIVAPIVKGMHWSAETAVINIAATNGFVNLFTPTCGFIMGGLALARIPYATYLNWVKKLLVILFVFVGVVIIGSMVIL